MNKDEIMKQFDEVIKNLKEWVDKKEDKAESDMPTIMGNLFVEELHNSPEWKKMCDAINNKIESKQASVCTECGCTFTDARTMCAECLMKLGKEPKPEWEEKLSRVFDTISPLPMEAMSDRVLREQHNIKVIWLKGFIRQEFKQLALDFKRELLPERYYPDVKQHTRNQMWIDNAILEALHKRGVK